MHHAFAGEWRLRRHPSGNDHPEHAKWLLDRTTIRPMIRAARIEALSAFKEAMQQQHESAAVAHRPYAELLMADILPHHACLANMR